MTWFRVDDDLYAHPKARKAGLAAMGLWTVCGSFAAGTITGGFVPEWYAASWPRGKKLAEKLVEAELWGPAVEDGIKGWVFHEWTFRNPTRKEAKDDKARKAEVRAESGRLGGIASGIARRSKREANGPAEDQANDPQLDEADAWPSVEAERTPIPIPKEQLQVLAHEGDRRSPISSSSRGAAGAQAGAGGETNGQRVNRLARVYTDRVKLANFNGVAGVVRKAVAADYTDEQIVGALNRLANDKRSVTADTLRIEIDGKPKNGRQMPPLAYTPWAGA